MSIPDYSGAFKSGSSIWQKGFNPSTPSIVKPGGSFPDYTGAFDPSKDSTFSNIWKTGFGPDRDEIFKALFDKTKETDKWQKRAERDTESPNKPFGLEGKSGQVLDNLAAVYPQQTYLPGQPGSPGFGGIIGSALGAVAGGIIGGPAGAGIGMQLGGGFGSMIG